MAEVRSKKNRLIFFLFFSNDLQYGQFEEDEYTGIMLLPISDYQKQKSKLVLLRVPPPSRSKSRVKITDHDSKKLHGKSTNRFCALSPGSGAERGS